jgi:hypothetical protein
LRRDRDEVRKERKRATILKMKYFRKYKDRIVFKTKPCKEVEKVLIKVVAVKKQGRMVSRTYLEVHPTRDSAGLISGATAEIEKKGGFKKASPDQLEDVMEAMRFKKRQAALRRKMRRK